MIRLFPLCIFFLCWTMRCFCQDIVVGRPDSTTTGKSKSVPKPKKALIKTEANVDTAIMINETAIEKEIIGVIYDKPDTEASFPGGKIGWEKHLKRFLNTKVAADNDAPEGSYMVEVKFVVDVNGNIGNITAQPTNYGMGPEAKRVILNSPKWIPASQDGRQVNAYVKDTITFVVNKVKISSSTNSESYISDLKKADSDYYNQKYVQAADRYIRHLEILGDLHRAKLQFILLFSDNVIDNYNEIIIWLKKQANEGSARAMSCIGKLYKNGLGVAKNLEEASEWYKKAAQKGDQYAMEYLRRLTEK